MGIIYGVKPFYYLCKIAGLVPFSFILNPEKGTEDININIYTNYVSVIWSLLIFCVILAGAGSYFSVMISSSSSTAHYVTTYMMSLPLTISMALLAICMNLTVNRRKFCELWKKLNVIDRSLLKYGWSKKTTWFTIEMVLVQFIVIPWLCVDSWLWRGRMSFIGEATLRLSHLIQLLVIIQFCKLIQFMRHGLKVLNRALIVSDEDKRGTHFTAEDFLNNRCAEVSFTDVPIRGYVPRAHRLISVENVSQDKVIYGKPIKASSLLEIRRIYGKIYGAVGCINSIYGLPVLLELVRNILSIIVNMLLLMNILRSPTKECTIYGQPSYLFAFLVACWIVFFISREVAITVTCHVTMSEAKKIQDSVQWLLLRQHITADITEQLKLFSKQLTVNSIEFTAFGFITLNLSALSTFIASVITYIVVLEQMK